MHGVVSRGCLCMCGGSNVYRLICVWAYHCGFASCAELACKFWAKACLVKS
jgi:hypothetical protein